MRLKCMPPPLCTHMTLTFDRLIDWSIDPMTLKPSSSIPTHMMTDEYFAKFHWNPSTACRDRVTQNGALTDNGRPAGRNTRCLRRGFFGAGKSVSACMYARCIHIACYIGDRMSSIETSWMTSLTAWCGIWLKPALSAARLSRVLDTNWQ